MYCLPVAAAAVQACLMKCIFVLQQNAEDCLLCHDDPVVPTADQPHFGITITLWGSPLRTCMRGW